MKRWILLVLASCSIVQPPPKAPSPGATCLDKSWYPGAGNTTVVFELNDVSPKTFVPDDMCILVDDKALLTNEHRNVVLPRLREGVTWRGTLAPGKHTFEVRYRTIGADKEPKDIVSRHTFDISSEMTIESRIQDDLSPHWYTAKGVPFLPKKADAPEPQPTMSTSAAPPVLPPTWYTAPSDGGTDRD